MIRYGRIKNNDKSKLSAFGGVCLFSIQNAIPDIFLYFFSVNELDHTRLERN